MTKAVMTRIGATILLAALLAWPTPALSQPLPDALRSAGVTAAQWMAVQTEVQTQARRIGVTETSLAAAAAAAGVEFARYERINPLELSQQIVAAVQGQAQQIRDLQARLTVLARVDDPTIASLLRQANEAINEGRLLEADEFMKEAADTDLAAIALAEAQVETRRLRAAETIGDRGALALTRADYRAAANHYSLAANTAPASARQARWTYHMAQGDALQRLGRRLTRRAEAYEEAGRLYLDQALPLVPAETHRSERLATLHALTQLSSGMDPTMWAVRGYEGLLQLTTPQDDRETWIQAQLGIGWYHQHWATMGDDLEEYGRAIEHYEAALAVMSAQQDGARWANIMLELALCHNPRGEAEKARNSARQALPVFEALGDTSRAEVARSIASAN